MAQPDPASDGERDRAGERMASHAHPELARLADALARRPGLRVVLAADEPAPRRAAVAVTLREARDGALELLLIKRADYEGDPWSGQVALPGGRHEPGDPSLEATAVRETFEETGVDLAFALAREVELTLSHEVAAAFWVPLSRLRDEGTSVETTVLVRGIERRVTCFRHGEHVIWGLTERILRQLVALTP